MKTASLWRWCAVAVVAVGLAGCGKGDKPSASAEQAEAPLKVALMSPGPISDDGWNASAYEGLQQIEAQVGAEIAQKQSSNEGEFKQDFRDFARRGYKIIFAHGFEFTNHARDVAEEFPETYFVTTGGLPENARANYSPVVFVLDDGLYLLGALAGSMTTTGKIGLIGGQDIPPVRASFNAFKEGAKRVRPDVQFVESYVGNWEDATKAREQANAQMKENVDFIAQNADKAGLGVFQSVKEARAAGKNVYAFGTNRDQNHVEPSVILASAVSKIPDVFVELAKRAKNGTFEGKLEYFTLTGGWIDVIVNPALADAIPQSATDAVEAARAALRNGEVSFTPEG
ncbi:MAG: BMP family protein [Candidatus Poribacteria bacterium]|nr:BMP family protein [Candidatus Poribacteria bacterium]